MKIIQKISDMIEDNIEEAEKYIKCAMEHKTEYPDLSRVLANISDNAMSNVTSLHNIVVQIIEQYRKENGEPPAPMMAVYDYLHKRHIDNASAVRAMQAMYKEMR